MSFQDEVNDWDHGQLVREVLRLRDMDRNITQLRAVAEARAYERDRALENCAKLEGDLAVMQRLKDEANVALAGAEIRAGSSRVFETPEHALHDFLRDVARRCFDECSRIASQWYGPNGRQGSESERGVAKELGALAERLQNLVRIVYNEYHSPGNGWRQ